MHKKLVIFAVSIALGTILNFSYAGVPAQAAEANALAALAQTQRDRGQFKEAESSYRKALSIDPLNTSALNGLLALYRQQGMTAKVQLTIAQLMPAQRNALGAALKRIESDMLQDQADLRLAKGQDDKAIAYLEQAVQVDADDPRVHFKLAQQYARRGSQTKGLELLEDFLARHQNDPDALYVLALYQSEQGDIGNALKTLNRIELTKRSPDMTLLQQHLTIRNLEQDAKSSMQSGEKNVAINMLSEAEAIGSGNEELTLAVALAWAKIGEVRHGRALFDQAKASQTPPSVSWHLRYANFLATIDSDRELHEELEIIAGMQNLSSAEKAALLELQESAAIRMADKQISAGNAAAAHQTLIPFLQSNPDQVPLLLADARAYRTERQWQSTLDIYKHILELNKTNIHARSGLIETLVASGNRPQALRQLDEWAADYSANDIAVGLHLSNMYADLGEYDRAQKQIDALLVAHPDATYVLYDAWKMARRAERTDLEIDYLRKLVIAEPAVRPSSSPGLPQNEVQPSPALAHENVGVGEFGSADKIRRDWKEKKLAALIDRRSRWFSAAMNVRNRTGTAGLSEFHSVEIPLEYKTPWGMNDEVFFRADLVKLDAGSVAATNSDFGSMLFCQPACASAPLIQDAQGVSFTAGYQRDDLGADIGVTPPNFPVSNIVGGIQKKGDLGQFGYSLEASRRPITASLLSYAGTKDPNTGKIWGGVVATGGRFGLSLDKGETFGFWSSLGLHNLTGSNVQSNRRFQLMAGEQWRVINEENRRLVFGLTGMYWNFTENAGEYSFGHGGYYSPHTYLSLALPITYVARTPRFSYMLRAAVSASRSQAKAAPFYPTDSAMQALAGATATYSGGSSSGNGYSLKGAWEYQVNPKLFIGGLLAIDRSASYAPNQVLFYLRYALDHPGAQPIFLLPEPIEPSSQFY